MVVSKLIAVARPILAEHPRLRRLAKWLVGLTVRLRFKIWQLKVKARSRAGRCGKGLDLNRTYWVKPDRIEYMCIVPGCKKYSDRGRVIGGDWDKKRKKLAELEVFQAFEDRFVRGRRWEETEFYRTKLKAISNGRIRWEGRNKAEFDERCKFLDTLYREISVNGYRSREEVAQRKKLPGEYRGTGEERNPFELEDEISVRVSRPFELEDEISVRMSRHGEYLFEDGRHRLAIAKLLDIDRIPIKVTVRHSEWCQFRREVIEYAENHGGKLYAPITHPDLCDIPAQFGEERFELLKAHLPMQSGDLLDIGAHWGYFCHRFEEEGFDCYAVEHNARHIYFLEKLRRAENRKFQVIHGSVFDLRAKTRFDVVLALNIHRFLKEEETYHELIELLKRLDVKVMFFQAHRPGEPQMKGAYRNYGCDEFVEFILENSCLNEALCIGEAKGVPIYRLRTM